MSAWTYDKSRYAYVYTFDGYFAEVYETESYGWVFIVWLAGYAIAQESHYQTREKAMVGASNALWDDYQDSVKLLKFCEV